MPSSTRQLDTAVILAAGRGTRLRATFSELPKGFLRLDGQAIVERSIHKLIDRGVTRILVGTGHLSEAYENLALRFREVKCVRNDAYASTGSMQTLFKMKDEIDSDFLLLESDLIYEKRGLCILLAEPRGDVVLASGRTNSGDEVYLETDAMGNLVNLSKDARRLRVISGEMVGISKLSVATFRKLCEVTAGESNSEYEHGLARMAKREPIYVRKVEDLAWSEIDDEAHLARATKSVFPEILRRDTDER